LSWKNTNSAASWTIIGNYERKENTSSTDIIVKLAAAFVITRLHKISITNK